MTDIARFIDHTALKAQTNRADILRLCNEAMEHGFASVCVPSRYVPLSTSLLIDTSVKVCTVVGFPLGNNSLHVKVGEAEVALGWGATEIDMVLPNSAIKARLDKAIIEELRMLGRVCRRDGALLKVIIETCYLDVEDIAWVCNVVADSDEAHFVKTSTGFGTAGATVEHIALMRETVGFGFGVKASGGIRTYEDAMSMIEAAGGIEHLTPQNFRLGCSAGVAIVAGAR